jgi:CRP-like cAMP-binding protein
MSIISQASCANLLLRALSPDDFALLAPHFERAELPPGTVVVDADTPVEHVHFAERGVVSVVTDQEGGDPVEYGLFGHEGMSGMPVVLDAGQTPHRSFVQVGPCASVHLAADTLADACRQSETLRVLLLRYVHTLTVQTAATAAANAHYALPERLARWLLMCHDRIDGDRLELTHQFMAQMLGVRRSGVTTTLHTLEAAGAIRSTRGLVTIIDRARLAEIAGESYGSPEREYARLIAPFGKG